MSVENNLDDKQNISIIKEEKEQGDDKKSDESGSTQKKNNNIVDKSKLTEDNNDITTYNENNEENEEKDEEEEEEDELEEEFIEAFNRLDEDHSGTITKEEIFTFMKKLGYRPSDLELREMMEEVSKEHPGHITYWEFKKIILKPIKDDLTLNSTIEAFNTFDKMGKGKIKKEDLKNILLTRGEQNMAENEIEELLNHYMDFDENGEVDYKNFVKKTFELFN